MRRISVAVAPLAEQKRIVAKVEELIARVNTAREHLAKVPQILKAFRQSVLAAACSGRLTEDWREEQPAVQSADSLFNPTPTRKHGRKRAGRLWGAGVVPELTEEERDSLPETWIWSKVRAVGNEPENTVQVGPMSMASRDFAKTGIPVLNVGCVQWGHFDLTKLNFLPPARAKDFDRYRIEKDDILFTRSGTVGRCAIASAQQNGFLMTFHLGHPLEFGSLAQS